MSVEDEREGPPPPPKPKSRHGRPTKQLAGPKPSPVASCKALAPSRTVAAGSSWFKRPSARASVLAGAHARKPPSAQEDMIRS